MSLSDGLSSQLIEHSYQDVVINRSNGGLNEFI